MSDRNGLRFTTGCAGITCRMAGMKLDYNSPQMVLGKNAKYDYDSFQVVLGKKCRTKFGQSVGRMDGNGL